MLRVVATDSPQLKSSHSGVDLDLNLLMLFREIVAAGSISRAAARLHTPKATLSRKLRLLEAQMSAVLLKRGPHRLEPTEIGQTLLHHCERIAAVVRDASQITSEMQSQLRGSMQVSMPFGLGNTWVSQALARFALRHPEVKLTIHVTNRWVDVSEEPYDVAIHIGRIRNEHLPRRCLAELPRGLYASPSYRERKGLPAQPAELLEHDCIVLESQTSDGLWQVATPDQRAVPVNPRMITTDIVVAREMALAGVGIAMLTHAVCKPDVLAGKLLRVLPDWPIPPVVVSATFLERRHVPLRVRAFIDLMAEAMESARLLQLA